MKKRMMGWILLAAFLLTGCGTLASGGAPVLPDAGDVERVTMTDGKTEVISRDAAFIARLLQTLGQAVWTGEATVQDDPGGAWTLRLDFGFRSGGESRLFLYRRGGVLLLEQPGQGVWRADRTLPGLLKEAGGWN